MYLLVTNNLDKVYCERWLAQLLQYLTYCRGTHAKKMFHFNNVITQQTLSDLQRIPLILYVCSTNDAAGENVLKVKL